MSEIKAAVRRARERASTGIRSAFSRGAVPAWIAAGALAVAIVVLIAVGAFDTVEAPPEPVAIGEEVRLDTYAVTVIDVEVTDAVEEHYFNADPGEVLLVVTMRLENLSDSTIGVDTTPDHVTSRLVGSSTSLLELTGVTIERGPRVWRGASSATPLLQPDVPAEITVGWAVDPDDLDEATLEVYNADVRHGQILLASNVITWTQGAHVARIGLGADR
ncbi:DUF4352 domain-containing protein [Microbacterium sp.]|uniref:DUF4352 domain-containing protein n=1 Tax=Microbacterium sp. TaxID=51671 RepID=UPI0039E63CF1